MTPSPPVPEARQHHREPVRFVRRRIGVSTRQRWAAVGAIAADLVGLVTLVILVVSDPLYTFALGLLAVVFLATFFFTVTNTGLSRRIGTIAASLLGAGFVVALVFWSPREGGPGFMGVATIALFVLGAALARVAFVVPPSTPDLFTVLSGRKAVGHPVAIVNLKSGGGKAEEFDIVGLCAAIGVETVVLEKGADLTELALDAVARGADVLGMAGGDGSLAYVAKVAADHDVPFVCIPAGTRNHFALDIGLDRTDPRQALSAFIEGEDRVIDYATVNGRMFLNNVSLGVYATIVEQETYRDAKVETTLQLLPELIAQGGPNFDLRFDVPGHERLEGTALLQVSNGSYDLSSGLGRRGSLTDGQLGVVTVDPQRTGDLVNLTVLAAAGWAEHASALWAWTTPELIVESGQSTIAAGLDGETVNLETPVRFTTVPGGLRLRVPVGSRIGLTEQVRPGHGTYAGLLDVAFGRPDPEPTP